MFAAFPGWYATLFSGFYLPLVLLLVALIVRGVSFEYRDKRESHRWRGTWSLLTTLGSLVAPFVIGVALGGLIHGVPIDAQQNFTGSVLDLFSPYSVFVGLTVVALCVTHGATFLALKVDGDMRDRARTIGRRAAPVTALAVLVLVIWTQALDDRGSSPVWYPRSGCWLPRPRPCWCAAVRTAGPSPRPRLPWRPASRRSSSASIRA